MNRYKNGKIFSLFLMCGILGACDKFEAIPLEYKSTPLEEAQEEVLNTIDPAWELELMETNGYVMAFKDKKYDKLFTRTLGWNGGDGVLTTLLPDGNAFWSFNDSFYGVVEGETRARKDCSFPRNSIMVQTPGDEEENLVWLADFVQTTTPEAPRYYQARTHIRHPKASLSDDKIQEGEIDQDWLYWAGDATVCNNKLQVLWNGVDNTNPDALMRHEGICLATYSLEGTPGDDNYMKLISADHHFNDVDIYGYGSTLWEDEDGHIYLYGSYNNYDMIVARTARHDLTSPWEYYVGVNKEIFLGRILILLRRKLSVLEFKRQIVVCHGYLKKEIPIICWHKLNGLDVKCIFSGVINHMDLLSIVKGYLDSLIF